MLRAPCELNSNGLCCVIDSSHIQCYPTAAPVSTAHSAGCKVASHVIPLLHLLRSTLLLLQEKAKKAVEKAGAAAAAPAAAAASKPDAAASGAAAGAGAAAAGGHSAADIAKAWKQYTAPDGRPYYHNKLTKQSKWVMPEEMKQAQAAGGSSEAAAAAAGAKPPPTQVVPLSANGVGAGKVRSERNAKALC